MALFKEYNEFLGTAHKFVCPACGSDNGLLTDFVKNEDGKFTHLYVYLSCKGEREHRFRYHFVFGKGDIFASVEKETRENFAEVN